MHSDSAQASMPGGDMSACWPELSLTQPASLQHTITTSLTMRCWLQANIEELTQHYHSLMRQVSPMHPLLVHCSMPFPADLCTCHLHSCIDTHFFPFDARNLSDVGKASVCSCVLMIRLPCLLLSC